MFSPEPLLSASLVERLGWMLVHACWQGALVAAVLAGTLRLLRHHAPSVRYGVSCVALTLLVMLPVGTSLVFHPPPVESTGPASAVPSSEVEAAQVVALLNAASSSAESSFAWTEVATWDEAAARVLRPWLPWLVAAWALGLLFAAGRFAGGALHVRRLRRRSTPAPAPWPDRLARLAGRLGIQASVPLRVSELVDGPMVVGWFRPVVLVPAGMLTGLPPNQVEALLVHELAHIRRHDVLVGWMQAVVEAVLFFHPAAWWISARIRQERELCCDDLAVETGADTLVYARALTAVAEQQVRPSLALAASEGLLLQRIRRLVTTQPSTDGWKNRVSLGAAVVLLAALPLLVAACASQQGTTANAASSSASEPTAVAADSSENRSVVVTEDDDETVFQIERDSGDVERYRMFVSGDSAEVAVHAAPQHRRRGEIRVYGDSVRWFVFSRDEDSLQRGALLSEDDAGNFVFRLERDSIGPNLLADTLRAKFRAPDITFSRDSLRLFTRPSMPNPPHVFFDDTIRVDPRPDRFHFWFHEDGDTLRGSFEERMEHLREWRDEWEEEWSPERREELERRLRRWQEEHADSLERWRQEWTEQFRDWRDEWEEEWPSERREELERHLRRWRREYTDSLEQNAQEWREHLQEWRDEHADAWAFRNREQRERWLRRHEQRADSVRAHARRLQERLESEQWERQLRVLREQAEHLRERAEQLEKRAHEMERRLAPPDSSK